MLKKLTLPALALAILAGCADKKHQEKVLLDSVTNEHEKVMNYEGAMEKQKSILKPMLTDPALKDSAAYYSKLLDDNDNAMMDWMNKFNPDFSGKSHEQIIDYLNAQKKLVAVVDSDYRKALNASAAFIKSKTKK
jgi:acetylornithine/succinyldiaminopimelate/putrescine aminotransferase